MYALDAETGKVEASLQLGTEVRTTPAVVAAADKKSERLFLAVARPAQIRVSLCNKLPFLTP